MRSIWMLSALTVLSACGSKSAPTGQVVATVNGEEITRAEINAALPNDAVADPKAAAQVRNAVLEKIVAQRLVAQEAKRENLDKSQPYLLATRRAESQILAEMMARRLIEGLRTPDQAAVDQYIAADPSRFGDRVIFQTDQVRAPATGINPMSLKDVHSLDGVVARLQAAGAQSARARVSVDSVGLPPAVTRQLLALPSGEPFVTVENGLLLASSIVSTQKAPLTGDKAHTVAANLLKQAAGADALQRQYATLRKGAEIHYQNGFAAPAKAPAVSSR